MSCVLGAAIELFDARQFPGVVAVCSEALEGRPRDVGLRLLRARALLALRRDASARAEVDEILRIDPRCGAAYRLLGELAVRRDEPCAARGFLVQALRLAPRDEEATVWLAIVDAMAGEDDVPAYRAHVRLRPRGPAPRPASAVLAPMPEEVGAPPPRPASAALAPTPEEVRAPAASAPALPAVAARASRPALPRPFASRPAPRAAMRPTAPPPAPARASAARPTVPPPLPPGAMRRRPAARGTEPPPVGPLTPLPTDGFGAYLVDVGVLSELQLRAALAYKKSTGVRLGAAAVALGFATETRIESASLVYHGRHRRPSSIDVVATARPRRHSELFQS